MYKVSPDGVFTVTLLTDPSKLNYTLVEKVRVDLKGSYVPFLKNDLINALPWNKKMNKAEYRKLEYIVPVVS